MVITVSVNEKKFDITLDSKIEVYFKRQLTKPFRFNNITSKNCLVCAVNRIELMNEYVKKAIKQICLVCNGEEPRIHQRVTGVLGFKTCKRAWWISNIYDPPTPPNIPAIIGTIMHLVDEKIDRITLSLTDNVDQIVEKYVLIITDDYLTSIKNELEKWNIDRNALAKELTDQLNNYSEIMSIKLTEDLKYNNQLTNLWKKILKEFQVISTFTESSAEKDIPFLITGIIDKLYMLNNNSLVRDDKTFKYIFQDCSLQLGGYKYCLEFMGLKPLDWGLIGYSRYFESFPHKCDSMGFAQILRDISKFILEYGNSKIPEQLEPNKSPCSIDECNYFDWDWTNKH